MKYNPFFNSDTLISFSFSVCKTNSPLELKISIFSGLKSEIIFKDSLVGTGYSNSLCQHLVI